MFQFLKRPTVDMMMHEQILFLDPVERRNNFSVMFSATKVSEEEMFGERITCDVFTHVYIYIYVSIYILHETFTANKR